VDGPNAAEGRQGVLDGIADVLNDLGGAVYTGRDMNTTAADMTYLASRTLPGHLPAGQRRRVIGLSGLRRIRLSPDSSSGFPHS
jgi:hypothetical protein